MATLWLPLSEIHCHCLRLLETSRMAERGGISSKTPENKKGSRFLASPGVLPGGRRKAKIFTGIAAAFTSSTFRLLFPSIPARHRRCFCGHSYSASVDKHSLELICRGDL